VLFSSLFLCLVHFLSNHAARRACMAAPSMKKRRDAYAEAL
jgi:hypothetical protein